jgi:hypothetical protein
MKQPQTGFNIFLAFLYAIGIAMLSCLLFCDLSDEVDRFGNPLGAKHDLVRDNYFKGLKITVLHLYTGEGFDFMLPQKALESKGFVVHRWTSVPSISEFSTILNSSNQLWIISNKIQMLTEEHLKQIRYFFENGKGIYVWGDNEPYCADANYVTQDLFAIKMEGNLPGEKTVERQLQPEEPGFINHPIMTGIDYLFEGVTIATVENSNSLTPLLYGSSGNLLISFYDNNGKRALIDGGYTRLFLK